MATVVLLEVMSIQKYVFGSNKLKENLGASFIVENIFEEFQKDIETSQKGYIGGGNAFVYFDTPESAKKRIREFTLSVLEKYPGISVSVALEEAFDELNFKESFKKLIEKLKQNANSFIPLTTLPAHGITAECKRTGLSAEYFLQKPKWEFDMEDVKNQYISSVSAAKFIAAKEAEENDRKNLKSFGLTKEYVYTNLNDLFGNEKGTDSHIAVVHIDGNDMGKRFENCTNDKEKRILSESVKDTTKNAFRNLIKFIDENAEKFKLKEHRDENGKRTGKFILPIRPIILGGDDITFICESKLGILFTQKYIEFFTNEKISKIEELSCCAGIAVVKSKYPFYRAYNLAEELCKNAKKKRRNSGSKDSWLDFHVSFGGFSNELKEIRENYYVSTDNCNLLMRPLSLSDLNYLTQKLPLLKTIANNKVMEIREILYQNTEKRQDYFRFLKSQKINNFDELFGAGTDFYSGEDENKTTPFFDLIELSSFEFQN